MKQPGFLCGWKYGAAKKMHHKTPAELENPGEKSCYFYTIFKSVYQVVTSDKHSLVVLYDSLDVRFEKAVLWYLAMKLNPWFFTFFFF